MIVHNIIHNNEIINDWYNEGEPIHKIMGGGMVVYQRYKITHQPPTPPTPTPIYRWVVVLDEFICSGTTKCQELKKQVSYDDGATWEDVIPLTYKAGAVIEYDSEDCGYIPEPTIIYRWIDLDPSVEYYCSGTTKMYKQQKEQSSDSGETWTPVVPSEFRMGEPYQTESEDCGYIPEPMYRWIDLDPTTDYYCSGTTKLYKQQEQVSMDSGATWEWVVPAVYKRGGVAEEQSTDCGYVPPTPRIYRWIKTDEMACVEDAPTPRIYRWIQIDETACVEDN